MTTALHLRALADAPVACDMSGAGDTADERLRAYSDLFERALVSRERRPDAVVFRFRAQPGIREAGEDLARRESACCPFLDYRIETDGSEVIWTTTNARTGSERASADVILDLFRGLPDHSGSDLAGAFLKG
jgi:hypothetical protein